jgi:hypothetical protein
MLGLLVGLRWEWLRRYAMVLVVWRVWWQRCLQQLQWGLLRGSTQPILLLLLMEELLAGVEALQGLRM